MILLVKVHIILYKVTHYLLLTPPKKSYIVLEIKYIIYIY